MLSFRISLNTESNVFLPNSQVSGTVHLEIEKELKAQKIDLQIFGVAKTKWHEDRRYSKNMSERIHFSAELFYIETNDILWQSSTTSDGIIQTLQPGKYQFPFHFIIPSNAAPCISGEFGNISYQMETNIDISWKKEKLKKETRRCEFFVYRNMDLNLYPQLASMASSSDFVIQNKCCSRSAFPLDVQISIPKAGYVLGETIEVKIEITNKTSWKIKKFEIGIYENIDYMAHFERSNYGYHTATGPRTVYKTSKKKVTSKIFIFNSSANGIITYNLEVPELIPTYRECSLIKNGYSLFVKASTNAIFSSGPEVLQPIIIGTVPIREPSAIGSNASQTKSSEKKSDNENVEENESKGGDSVN
uniref:Arrestin C-terminal-like domain-containing protein n=1 Tax=Panagrolaimus sp. ES5 TaxID=591445 RepID=A0AC34FW14_9BILA